MQETLKEQGTIFQKQEYDFSWCALEASGQDKEEEVANEPCMEIIWQNKF